MKENKALAAWRRDEQTVGCWLSVANAYTAEAMARMGFDWLCVDLQHGIIDYTDLAYMLPAISNGDTTPLVRVPWNEPYQIMRVLDLGASGVIIPMVNNREEAEKAVAACRYPPEGNRSFGPIRAAMVGGKGYAKEANDQIACLAMIETPEGIENVEEIVTTPGLTGVYIGPSDLALALGLPAYGDQPQEEHLETVKHILETCKKHGVVSGMHTSSLEYTKKYLDLGFNMVMLGSETAFMMRTASMELAEAKGSIPEVKESTGY